MGQWIAGGKKTQIIIIGFCGNRSCPTITGGHGTHFIAIDTGAVFTGVSWAYNAGANLTVGYLILDANDEQLIIGFDLPDLLKVDGVQANFTIEVEMDAVNDTDRFDYGIYDSAGIKLEEGTDQPIGTAAKDWIMLGSGQGDHLTKAYNKNKMGIEIFKNGIYKFETGFIASSKPMLFGTRYRKQISLDDDAVTRYLNFIIVDMSAWVGFTARADNTNYVRVVEHLDADETGIEINSQTIDGTWAGGNHTHVAFLNTQTDTKSTFTIYYGDIDLGAPGYASDLSVTADTPAANDFTIQQDSYYKIEMIYAEGGKIRSFFTRISGGNIEISDVDSVIGDAIVRKNITWYYSRHELTPTVTEIEGTTGANAGAILVAFKVTGVLEDVANNPLQDNSAVNVTFENIYIFTDNQLFQCRSKIIFPNACNNIKNVGSNMYVLYILNDYFSHQSYKYSSTHVVEILQDRDLSAQYANKKYYCYFDPISNDGIAAHFVSENNLNIETPRLFMDDTATYELADCIPDNSGTDTIYSAGTESSIMWYQIDDFSEADGDNDDDGDQPAHRKNTELLTTLTQAEVESVSF